MKSNIEKRLNRLEEKITVKGPMTPWMIIYEPEEDRYYRDNISYPTKQDALKEYTGGPLIFLTIDKDTREKHPQYPRANKDPERS